MKNTVSFNKGKLITTRFRHPRFSERNEALLCYHPEYAEVKAIIINAGDYSYHKIIFFHDFIFIDSEYKKDTSTLVISDKSIIAVFQVKKQIFNINIKEITNCELHILGKEKYLILFETKKKKKHYIYNDNLSFCTEVYATLEKIGVAKKAISN